ncbi:hypothetical protein [Nocardia sp. NPDC058666]|uniref:hypothetical protein n=1 Tax=unclassified Nocardia TaxID=2637762 RepID=UPI00364782B0
MTGDRPAGLAMANGAALRRAAGCGAAVAAPIAAGQNAPGDRRRRGVEDGCQW